MFNLYRKSDSSKRTSKRKSYPSNDWKKHQKFEQHSTGAFAANERNNHRCYYCDQDRWSDECKQFADIKTRKGKAKGCCFICLKKGHLLKDCKSKKPCVYCKKSGNHHQSLGPKQFGSTEEPSAASTKVKESNLVAVGEQVIMQTAMVNLVRLMNHDGKCETKTRLLLDCGAQRSYISEELVKKMNLKPISKNLLFVYTFGTTKPKNIESPVIELGILLNNGFTTNIKANVVPNVTGSFERKPVNNKSIK